MLLLLSLLEDWNAYIAMCQLYPSIHHLNPYYPALQDHKWATNGCQHSVVSTTIHNIKMFDNTKQFLLLVSFYDKNPVFIAKGEICCLKNWMINENYSMCKNYYQCLLCFTDIPRKLHTKKLVRVCMHLYFVGSTSKGMLMPTALLQTRNHGIFLSLKRHDRSRVSIGPAFSGWKTCDVVPVVL